jgi:hypothetical protein
VRVTPGDYRGWRAIGVDNGELRFTVLPDRGAEIVELIHVATGIDVLFHAPWGLAPPGAPPREGSGGHAFLEGYAGGWQELFPSVNDPCSYRGEQIPFHGEVATLPWSVEPPDDGALRCHVDSRSTPLRLERRMRLEGSELMLEEVVTNRGSEEAYLVWGHHCVLGPPLVEAGARLRVPARTIVTVPELWEDTARLEPGQRSRWPNAALRAGGTADLSVIRGPEDGSHDDVYLTDLEAGWAEVENARLGLAFRLHFDPQVFRWLISWQPYGGAEAMPLAGSYALGVEPWTSMLCLEQAIAAGDAIALAAGAAFSTTLRAALSVT